MTSMRLISRTLTHTTRTLDKSIMAIQTSEHFALSKFNYFNVYGIMDRAFYDCFGLEKHEVINILMKLGIPEATAKDEWRRAGGIRCWYNGYRIGNRKLTFSTKIPF